MTQQIIEQLLAQSHKHGLHGMTRDYLLRYIEAHSFLKTNPDDVAAAKIVQEFKLLMDDFGRFTLPHEIYERYVLGGYSGEGANATDV